MVFPLTKLSWIIKTAELYSPEIGLQRYRHYVAKGFIKCLNPAISHLLKTLLWCRVQHCILRRNRVRGFWRYAVTEKCRCWVVRKSGTHKFWRILIAELTRQLSYLVFASNLVFLYQYAYFLFLKPHAFIFRQSFMLLIPENINFHISVLSDSLAFIKQ